MWGGIDSKIKILKKRKGNKTKERYKRKDRSRGREKR